MISTPALYSIFCAYPIRN